MSFAYLFVKKKWSKGTFRSSKIHHTYNKTQVKKDFTRPRKNPHLLYPDVIFRRFLEIKSLNDAGGLYSLNEIYSELIAIKNHGSQPTITRFFY